MGQVLHSRATTTQATRRAIQNSQESLKTLAKRYNINPKTVAKWRKRTSVADMPMGPKERRSTVLSREEEAVIVAFRQQTLLPLDDCLYALQETIPHLSRSSLHRCLERAGISQLPKESNPRMKKAFKKHPPGYFHIDIAEVRTEEGKLYLFVGIDRTTKYTYARFYKRAKRQEALDFLGKLHEAVPYKIKIVLTDNGVQFALREQDRHMVIHPFSLRCEQMGIEHRQTQVKHPWTNGQVERMNRTLKEATVRKYHYRSWSELCEHLNAFLDAYNYGKRLKSLRGLTPYESILKWSQEGEISLSSKAIHYNSGPNN